MNKKMASILVGSILTLGLTVGCTSTNSSSDENIEKNTVEVNHEDVQKEEVKKDPSFKLTDGMYKVGIDLESNEYLLVANRDKAYFEVTTDSSGSTSSIVFNDIFSKNRYITVEDGQYLKLSGCSLIKIEDSDLNIDDMLTDGMFKVGVDIPSGEYKLKSEGDKGYFEVTLDSQNISPIVSNDIFSDERYITVEDGQYLKLSNGVTLIK